MSELLTSIEYAASAVVPRPYVAPFDGYQAPQKLPNCFATQVAAFDAKTPESASCILFEAHRPEVVFSAFILDSRELVSAILDTAAQGANAVLLADICECFAQGSARLELPEGIGRMPKVASRIAVPTSSGQDVDVYRSILMSTWTLVAARPRRLMSGECAEGLSVYLSDDVISDRLSRAFHAGTIRARKLPGEYLS